MALKSSLKKLRFILYNSKGMDTSHYYTLVEFAKLAQVSRQAIYKAIKEGRIKGGEKQGRDWWIPKNQLKAFVDNKRF